MSIDPAKSGLFVFNPKKNDDPEIFSESRKVERLVDSARVAVGSGNKTKDSGAPSKSDKIVKIAIEVISEEPGPKPPGNVRRRVQVGSRK